MTQEPTPYRRPQEMPLHPRAADLIANEGEWFARILAAQSRVRASLEGTDEVQTKHVRESSDFMIQAGKSRSNYHDVLLSVAGILAGAFWPLVLQEATKAEGSNDLLVALYSTLGGTAALVVFVYLARAVWEALREPRGKERSRPTANQGAKS